MHKEGLQWNNSHVYNSHYFKYQSLARSTLSAGRSWEGKSVPFSSVMSRISGHKCCCFPKSLMFSSFARILKVITNDILQTGKYLSERQLSSPRLLCISLYSLCLRNWSCWKSMQLVHQRNNLCICNLRLQGGRQMWY